METSNIEAEASFLGAVMLDNDVLDKYPLSPNDFSRDSHRLIYETMQALKRDGTPSDLVTITQRMRTDGTLNRAGGITGISYLSGLTPSKAMAGHYAKIIKGESQKRKAVRIAEALKSAIESGEDVGPAIGTAYSSIANLMLEGKSNEKTKVERLLDFTNWVERRSKMNGLPGIPTGNADLDNLTFGWQDGELIILAARPGMGKTALALNFLHDAAARGFNGKFFSLEMPNEQIFARLAAMEKGVTASRIMNPIGMSEEDWAAFLDAAGIIERLPLDVDDSKRTYIDISRQIRRDVAQGTKLVIIDYLQLIQGDRRENRTQEISAISNDLKRLAVELRVPIICLSQLSRAVESRSDKRPMLSDLRESGSIEQDADVVLFLYRDDYYHETTNNPWAELEIAKQRKGKGQGKVKMAWSPNKMRFHYVSQAQLGGY